MAEQREDQKKIGFKSIQLLKSQSLGAGSYGTFIKAKCDDLLCVAKLMDEFPGPTALDDRVLPSEFFKKFEQECELLKNIRHPNIVQFLGICQDPDTGLPALIMEQMDDSLTNFLESSPQPIPYYIQVNLCHDIVLALSYLHSNAIIHRDLSSDNVLLIGNVRAKVTDFGMGRLGDMNHRAADHVFSICPGTDVYMPPEAVQDRPVYTEKIDIFSFGVLCLQILTRKFPQPRDRQEEIKIECEGLVEKRISEQERRQDHISKIDPNHPLLIIALDCLKDKDVDRPLAKELCKRIASLKRNDKYNESARVGEELSCEIGFLQHKYTEIIQEKDRTIMLLTAQLEERAQTQVYESELPIGKESLRDHEEMNETPINRLNTNQKKLYRKKFGIYPLYRRRYNGVKCRSCESSDDECNRSANQGDFRGSRSLALANKHKTLKPMKRKSSPSCDEENDEESEPHMTSTKRQKRITKARQNEYDLNSTTSSEASDIESLTDCSLYWSEN